MRRNGSGGLAGISAPGRAWWPVACGTQRHESRLAFAARGSSMWGKAAASLGRSSKGFVPGPEVSAVCSRASEIQRKQGRAGVKGSESLSRVLV